MIRSIYHTSYWNIFYLISPKSVSASGKKVVILIVGAGVAPEVEIQS